MIAISACLGGVACRYDGKSNTVEGLKALVEQGEAIVICPEVMGGLEIPRDPCERRGNQVCTQKGKDCNAAFQKGASGKQDHNGCLEVQKSLLWKRFNL